MSAIYFNSVYQFQLLTKHNLGAERTNDCATHSVILGGAGKRSCFRTLLRPWESRGTHYV